MQTLEHRRLRRDMQTDSAFTTMVLNIEQRKLDSQAWKAQVILSARARKSPIRRIRRRNRRIEPEEKAVNGRAEMLNAYPDNLGGTLSILRSC